MKLKALSIILSLALLVSCFNFISIPAEAATTYYINVTDTNDDDISGGGTIAASVSGVVVTKAASGATVKLTVSMNHEVESITVTGVTSGDNITVTEASPATTLKTGQTFTFTMPAEIVDVKVSPNPLKMLPLTVYLQQGSSGTPVLVKSYSQSDLESLTQTTQYYTGIDALPAVVQGKGTGVLLSTLVEDLQKSNANLCFGSGAQINLYCADVGEYQNGSYTYDYLEGSTRYYYPNLTYITTSSSVSTLYGTTDCATAIQPMLCVTSVQDRSLDTGIITPAVISDNTTYSQDTADSYRFIFGLTSSDVSDYPRAQANVARTVNLFAEWVNQVTFILPESYAVDIDNAITGGNVTSDVSSAAPGDTVTLTVSPDEGNRLKSGTLKATYNDGSDNYTATLTAEGNNTYTFSKPAYAVTVTAQFESSSAETVAVTGVTLDKSTDTLTVGETDTLTATVEPDNATNQDVSWSSADESIAVVDDSGIVTAVATGNTTITVTTEDGSYQAACAMTVSAVEYAAISLSPASQSVYCGKTFDVTVNIDTQTPSRGWQLDLSFDPDLLTANSVAEGDFLSDWADNNSCSTVSIGQMAIDNSAGTISDIGYFITGSTTGGASGSGNLCTISFTAKDTEGTADITLSNAVVSDSATVAQHIDNVTTTGGEVDISASTVDLVLTPSTDSISVGETFEVDIQAEAGDLGVVGIDAYLDFDPEILAVAGITEGETLDTVIRNYSDNSTGHISYSAGILNGSSSGTFTVATIRFVALAATTVDTAVTFSTTDIRYSMVTTTDGINVTGNLTGGSYTVVSGVDVDVAVVLQGGARPDSGWIVPLTVKFFTSGASVLTATPLYTFTENTTKDGSTAVITCEGIPPGTYDISAVSSHTLVNVKKNVVVDSSTESLSLGTLLEGNANNDSKINIADFSILSGAYGTISTSLSYNTLADFDRNGSVNIADFSLLSGNYNQISPVTIQ